jgi:hypothetical protein
VDQYFSHLFLNNFRNPSTQLRVTEADLATDLHIEFNINVNRGFFGGYMYAQAPQGRSCLLTHPLFLPQYGQLCFYWTTVYSGRNQELEKLTGYGD